MPEILPPKPKVKLTTLGREIGREAFFHEDISSLAAGLAYYLLFSLFPLALVFVTLLGLLPIPNLDQALFDVLARVAPPDLLALLRNQVFAIANERRGGLFTVGFLLAIWSASSAVVAAISCLNRSYHVEEGRPFWRVRLRAIELTLGLAVLLVGALVLLAFGPLLGERLGAAVGLGRTFLTAWSIVRWPLILAGVSLGAAWLYYFGPDVEQKWKWITPGSLVAMVLWVAASVGLTFYAQRFGTFRQAYGALGAVMVLMVWLYLAAFSFLFGGVVNAVIEHLEPTEGKAPGQKTFPEERGPAPESGQAAPAPA